MQQKRLLIALLISVAILFVWSTIFPVRTPEKKNGANSTPSPVATSSPPGTQLPPVQASSTNQSSDSQQQTPAQRRIISIKTPLYDAKFDTQGAEVVSWIIKKNSDTGHEISSVGGSKAQKLPLELISQEAANRVPRALPLQVVTNDSSLDSLLDAGVYEVDGIEANAGDSEIVLSPHEKRQIQFKLDEPKTGLSVIKTLVFQADNYTVDLEVLAKRYDQPIPQAKLRVGPSIGDQGIKKYTFYSVAPEGIASVGNAVQRHHAAQINENKSTPDRLEIPGKVDWAAVGDTYFAMVAIPAVPVDGLEYRTVQYDHQSNGKAEKRYLISGFLPIAENGLKAVVYSGPKDHYILTRVSQEISKTVGRSLELEGLIDYGFLSWLSKPIAVPILGAIKWLQQQTNSYGIAIILFTIIIYSLFFPLKWRSSKSMKKAQKLAPRMKELQEKIKGLKQSDPKLKELQMEQLRLMKEGNPLGGCLPLFIQMPFLFALYRAITISLDFRQATFLWLPDLSAGDPFHILEILMAGTMIVLQLITPAPSADPVQRKMMAIGMPLFMLYVLWGAPSGLLLYWLVGNIVGFSQQFLINHLTKSEDDQEPPKEASAKRDKQKKTVTPRVSQA